MSRIDELIAELTPRGVGFKTLGDIARLVRGNGMPKTDLTEEGVGAIHYGQIYTRYGVWASSTFSFVAPETATRLTTAEPGDIIITNTSENLEDVGKAVAWLGGESIVTGGHATVVKHHEDPKYLSYWFQSTSFFAQKKALATGTKVVDVSAKKLMKVRVPVPPLEVQREIVRVLDQFTRLEAELEAELETRRRQYEHYRRLLLAVPDEAAWTTLGDATENHDRKRKPVTRADRQDGEYPYYGANGIQDYVHDFIFEGTFLLVGEDGSVKRSDGTPVLNWAEGQIWVNNHAHVLTARDDRFSLRYLLHFLSTVDISAFVTGSTQPKLNQMNLNQIQVPLLARDGQERIVVALDKFDALVNDLSFGLPAEIAARRQQYEYYRDKLLAFKEATA